MMVGNKSSHILFSLLINSYQHGSINTQVINIWAVWVLIELYIHTFLVNDNDCKYILNTGTWIAAAMRGLISLHSSDVLRCNHFSAFYTDSDNDHSPSPILGQFEWLLLFFLNQLCFIIFQRHKMNWFKPISWICLFLPESDTWHGHVLWHDGKFVS